MLLLQCAKKRPALAQYVSLPLTVAYIVRPTASIAIIVITAYILLYYRACFVRYVIWASLVAVPWIAFNVWIYGGILSPYYLGSYYSGTPLFAVALAGNLISPSRGLFMYSPILVFALSGFVWSLHDPEQRPLHLAYGAIVILMLIAISLFPHWWAGWSYGPRYMTDLLPFLAFFTAFNVVMETYGRIRRIVVLTSASVLVALSLMIHAQGAIRWPPHLWNSSPNDIDQNPSRLWDWKDPAFLR
jgi:hypothetical protein